MSPSSKHVIDYNEVPADFPGDGADAPTRWADWGVCEELAKHLGRECL
jgi:hypothetical protein